MRDFAELIELLAVKPASYDEGAGDGAAIVAGKDGLGRNDCRAVPEIDDSDGPATRLGKAGQYRAGPDNH